MLTRFMNFIPAGYHTATPYLTIDGAAAAIDFYKAAFAAEEVMRINMPDGRVGHDEIKIGNSRIALSDEFPDWQCLGPKRIGGTPVTIMLYLEDVDAVVARAVAAGATQKDEVRDQFYGDRCGKITDPFGHVWMISTHIEDVSVEEMQRRLDEMCRQGSEC